MTLDSGAVEAAAAAADAAARWSQESEETKRGDRVRGPVGNTLWRQLSSTVDVVLHAALGLDDGSQGCRTMICHYWSWNIWNEDDEH